jgi:DNA-directed RNA polymerase alpha subunit
MNDEAKEKLLDFFAIEAMKILIVKRDDNSRDAYRLAGDAYFIAEKMLEQRERVLGKWNLNEEVQQKSKEEIEQDSIEQLNLTRRSEWGLKAEGIFTMQQLQLYTERRLMKIPNLGRKSITEIIQQMAALGYNLKDYA